MKTVPNLAEIEELLCNFSRLQRFDRVSFDQFLRDVQPHIDRLHAAQVSQRLRMTPDFNIFAITKRGDYEVTTHSAFLAHLFNPLGTHLQGDLFLSSFLGLLKQRLPQWVCAPSDRKWRIQREIDHIDITLEHDDPHCCIIIENKWNMPDTKDQLLHYWLLKRNQHGNKISFIPSIYLTKTGRPPLFSRANSLPNEFVRGMIRMSYGEIYELLNSLLGQSQIKSIRVQTTIEQYLDIIGDYHDHR